MEDEGWSIEDGSLRMENRERKEEEERKKVKEGSKRIEEERIEMYNQTEDVGWKRENGGQTSIILYAHWMVPVEWMMEVGKCGTEAGEQGM
jgi:hypothetical protein